MVEIRKATVDDCLDIEKLAIKVGLVNYKFGYRLLSLSSKAFVATKNRTIIGFISYLKLPLIRSVYCLQIGVDPAEQGQGVGKSLLNHLYSKCYEFYKTKYIWAHTVKPESYAWFQNKMQYKTILSGFGVAIIKSPSIC